MIHAYLSRLAAHPRLLLSSLLLAAAPAAHAQFAFNTSSGLNTTGTYADLSITGTAISTSNTDNANSAAQNIGFTFNYNGQSFTQFVLNTNGLLRLGAAAPSAANMFGQYEGGTYPGVEPVTSTNPADVNLIMPFNFDLEGATGAEYRVATTGTAPNRVCTVQWKNVSDKADASPKQYSSFSFQVKLYETTNVIEFVYGTATSASSAATTRYPTVGIKGSGRGAGQTVLAYKEDGAAWSTTIFISGDYDQYDYLGETHDFQVGDTPAAGRTYRFTPCTPAVITTFPYSENFTSVAEGDVPCAASVNDVNNDYYTWFTGNISSTSPNNVLVYFYNDDDPTVGGNDWYYTPGLTLRTGYTYQLKFDYRAGNAAYPEALEVKWGNAATPAAQTSLLFSNTSISNVAFATTTTTQVATITPTASGIYYIGFHDISAPDQLALLIDNIVVTETRVLSTRNAANDAFTAEAAPVPFGDQLSLHLTTKQAGPLALTLRDALGRTVRHHRATAPLGASTVAVPEVASLPAGIYLLTVEQGGQSQTLRVTHE